HGAKYDYSMVDYQGSFSKVELVCGRHGIFRQTPNSHLQGQGCGRCGIEARASLSRKSLEEFVAAARAVHGDKYDYGKVRYAGNKTAVEIVCSPHGSFWMPPNRHLSNKAGCPYCAGKKVSAENCLLTVNPEVAAEWHPTKNGSLTPADVTGSGHDLV